jgi:hypothetical protein
MKKMKFKTGDVIMDAYCSKGMIIRVKPAGWEGEYLVAFCEDDWESCIKWCTEEDIFPYMSQEEMDEELRIQEAEDVERRRSQFRLVASNGEMINESR